MTHTTTDAAEARATAFAECAAIAERWRDENKTAAAKARKSARARGDNGMADQLEGAAIECNAIAQEIHRLATAEAASGAVVTAATATEDQLRRIQLLADVELHLKSCRIFLTSREKMHPCGVDLHDELLAKVSAAIEQEGRNG